MPRDIQTIITEIVKEQPPLTPDAVDHLVKIKTPADRFHIRSFLFNAKNWRGHVARRIKAELREYLK